MTRRPMGPELVVTGARGYRLCVESDDVDALRFGMLAASGDLDGALALWHGPALADILELPFAGPAAARLEERRAVVVEDRATIALRTGRPYGELDALAAQLDASPLRETTAALLVRCLHAAGRQADALAAADRTIARLAAELGVVPGPGLAAARLAVLRGEAPAVRARGPRSGLDSFVGRDLDVERVRELLAVARLVTIIGPGGAGKTRLAREAVAGDAAAVAELAPLTGGEQLATAVLAAVGGPELVLRIQDEPAPTSSPGWSLPSPHATR